MTCAIASQMERKKPGSHGYDAGTGGEDITKNLRTANKYLDLLITDSELTCKKCIPTGYKCTLASSGSVIDGDVGGQTGVIGDTVDSYIYTDDNTLKTGLMPRMIDTVGRLIENISLENAVAAKKNAVCRTYPVTINKRSDGSEEQVYCNIADETIKNANFNINSFDNEDAKYLAQHIRSRKESFNNMNKLNPQNLTFDDDMPMQIYYGLLGVGGIYLLYQLSKKYGNKLNFD